MILVILNNFRTAKAMTGHMTFQEALKLRLNIIQPTLLQVKEFIKTQPPTLTPGIKYLHLLFIIYIFISRFYNVTFLLLNIVTRIDLNFRKLVNLLHFRHIPVFLISGGFRCIIAPVAHQLHIRYENIFANRMKFFFTGVYFQKTFFNDILYCYKFSFKLSTYIGSRFRHSEDG